MLEQIMAAWMAQAVTVAADLRVADALANDPLPLEELANRVGADEDALRRLLRALISHGVFHQRRDGRYERNPLGDALRSDVPGSVAGMARWVGALQHREHWSHLVDAVRTGRPVVPEVRGMDVFDYLATEPELSEIFNSAMTSVSASAMTAVTAGYDFTPYSTIVDVGGGHGRVLAAILAAAPAARGVLYDLPQVTDGASVLLRERGVAERVQIVSGSFFDSVPSGGDAYVLKSVIHDWPDDKAAEILRNIRAACGAGTTVLLIEAVIPKHAREFIGMWADLEMLVTTSGGRERSAAEYRGLLARAGFRMAGVRPTAGSFSVVEATAV